eukprot:6834325-Pyramimonas_sp.AAC.1
MPWSRTASARPDLAASTRGCGGAEVYDRGRIGKGTLVLFVLVGCSGASWGRVAFALSSCRASPYRGGFEDKYNIPQTYTKK